MVISELVLKVSEVLLPLLLSVLTLAVVKLTQFVNAKVKNEYLKNVLVRVDDAVLTTVRHLQQNFVEDLKNASADGKLSEEEKKNLKDQALNSVYMHLGGDKGLSEVKKVLGVADLDSLLSSKVEAAVHSLKNNSPLW